MIFKSVKSFMEKQSQPLLDGGYACTGAEANFVHVDDKGKSCPQVSECRIRLRQTE